MTVIDHCYWHGYGTKRWCGAVRGRAGLDRSNTRAARVLHRFGREPRGGRGGSWTSDIRWVIRGRRTGARRLVPSLAAALLVLTIVVPTTARAGEGQGVADHAGFVVGSAVHYLNTRFEITPTISARPTFSFHRDLCVPAPKGSYMEGTSTFYPDGARTKVVINDRLSVPRTTTPSSLTGISPPRSM